MICQNAIGYHNEIQELLKKSMLNMNDAQIRAWMEHEFKPETMFCYWQDGRLTSCLQTKRRILSFKHQKIAVATISLAATLPDYRQRDQFGQLLEAFLEQSSHNELLTMVYTNFPKLFENRSFSCISKTKYYWIPADKCNQGNDKNIRFYHPNIDLYPLYLEFMSHFDGSIILSKKDFEDQIHYALDCKKKVALMMHGEKPHGFAIYKVLNNHVKIDVLVYLDSNAILDLLRYLAIRNDAISFVVSMDERIEKLFPFDIPRNQGTVLARLNNYKLFSKWTKEDVRNANQAFKLIQEPMWNHFIE